MKPIPGSFLPEPASVQPIQTRVGQPEAQAPPSDPKIIKQWLTYAASLGRQGRFDEAVHALQRVVEEDPRSLEVRNALIQFALQKGDFATVIYQPMDCAELCILNDNTQCAIGHYDAILGMEVSVLTPQTMLTQRQVVAAVKPEIYLRLGEFHLEQGRTDDALRLLTRSQQLKPGIWETHMVLGRCFLLKAMFQEAMGEFRQVLRLAQADDQDVQDRAYEMLSLALKHQGDSPDSPCPGL